MSKPGTPANAATPANGERDEATSPVGKGGKTSKKGATPVVGAGSRAASTSRQGGKSGLNSPEPSPTNADSKTKKSDNEQKEPTDDEYLRQLYASQQEAERIASLEKSHDTLLTTVAELHRQIASNDAKHIDALMHRKREKQEAAAHTKLLQERIVELEAQVAQLQETAIATAASTAAAHSQQIMGLEDRMAVIQAKYESLYEFKEQKADLELQLAKYQELLAQEKENHALNVSELERRNVMEKDRLKNEMLRKIRETKLSLLAMTEDQLHTTTKRTIMENEQMTTELQYQSKETERIVKRNDKLAKVNADLKRELELSSQTQQQMAKKTMFYQNLITKLQGKLDLVEMEKNKEKQQFTHSMQQLQSQMAYYQGGAMAAQQPSGKFSSASQPMTPYDRIGGNSSLSGILRGVEEMNALATAATSSSNTNNTNLPQLTGARHTISQQTQQRKVESRTSYAGATPVSDEATSATIARLNDKILAVERERTMALEQARQALASAREEKQGRQQAEEHVQRLEQDIIELQAQVQRYKSHQLQTKQLSEQALSFIASCLEDQRVTLSLKLEQDAAAAAELEHATLHSVVAEGSESTVVVRAAGEKAVQGTTALLEQSRQEQAGRAPTPSSSSPRMNSLAGPKSTAAPPLSWDPATKGYPSSLTSFTPAERIQILEHLFSQMNVFQRTNPKEMGLSIHAISTNSNTNNPSSDTASLSSTTSPSQTASPSLHSYPPPHPNTNRQSGSFSQRDRASPALSARSNVSSRAE